MLTRIALLAAGMIAGLIMTSCGPTQAQLDAQVTEVAAEIFTQATVAAELQAAETAAELQATEVAAEISTQATTTAEFQIMAIAQAKATIIAESNSTATAEAQAAATAEAQAAATEEAQPRHSGHAGDYIPELYEMPAGFTLNPGVSGPSDGENGYTVGFQNWPNAFSQGDPTIIMYQVVLYEQELEAEELLESLSSDTGLKAWLETFPRESVNDEPTGRRVRTSVMGVDESIGFSASGIGIRDPNGDLQSSFEIILRDSNLIARVNLIGLGTTRQVAQSLEDQAFYYISLVTEKLR